MNESDLRKDVHYLSNSESKAWKKIQACRRFEPMTSAIPSVLYFNQQAIIKLVSFVSIGRDILSHFVTKPQRRALRKSGLHNTPVRKLTKQKFSKMPKYILDRYGFQIKNLDEFSMVFELLCGFIYKSWVVCAALKFLFLIYDGFTLLLVLDHAYLVNGALEISDILQLCA